MKSLYFNTKLTGSQLHDPKKLNNFSFYPLMYPRENEGLSQFEILIGVIESFKLLTFNNAIFNIEIDSITKEEENILLEAISSNINSIKKTCVNLSRPSNKIDWCKDVSYYMEETKDKSPFLVIMNHDHPYVDYSENVLDSVVDNVFGGIDKNYKKVMYYSHAPEVISKSINEKGVNKYSTSVGSLYQHKKINEWLDSICFMTLETLLHIFSSANIGNDAYLGRFDWVGVYYKSLDLTGYSYCREFFRHYDGYGHITGMRIDTQITAPPFGYSFPDTVNLDEISNFYYLRWVDCYLFTIKDSLRKKNLHKRKAFFVKIINFTLEEFMSSYIDQDCKNNFFPKKDSDRIKSLLTSRVYYNANMIYSEVMIDNELSHIPLRKRISRILSYSNRVKIKSFMLKFTK